LRILQHAGIPGDPAVAAFCGIVALNYGLSSFVLAREAVESAGGGGGVQLPPPPGFPLTAAVADPMNRYGSEEHYERTLQQLLAGIEADCRTSPSDGGGPGNLERIARGSSAKPEFGCIGSVHTPDERC